jgi:hypothetical protein
MPRRDRLRHRATRWSPRADGPATTRYARTRARGRWTVADRGHRPRKAERLPRRRPGDDHLVRLPRPQIGVEHRACEIDYRIGDSRRGVVAAATKLVNRASRRSRRPRSAPAARRHPWSRSVRRNARAHAHRVKTSTSYSPRSASRPLARFDPPPSAAAPLGSAPAPRGCTPRGPTGARARVSRRPGRFPPNLARGGDKSGVR